MHAALQFIEATHGFAQSLQRAQPPGLGAAESMRCSAPKGSAPPGAMPAPNPTASRVTRTRFVSFGEINIIGAKPLATSGILDLWLNDSKGRSKIRHLPL